MMARNTVPPPVDPALPLAERTRELVARFDAEEKDPGFSGSADALGYAEWFADLLEEWQVLITS